MITIKDLNEIRVFQPHVAKLLNVLKGRVSSGLLEEMEAEIWEMAVEMDRIINKPDLVSKNIQRVLGKCQHKKRALHNALVELNRCLLVIEHIAVAEGIKPKQAEIDSIKYDLSVVKLNIASAKLLICLPLNPNRALRAVKDFLIESSKQVDSLIDVGNCKLSKRVKYAVSKLEAEMQAALDNENEVFKDIEGKTVAVEDDTEYVDFTFGEVLEIFKDIENVINEYMEQYPD